MTDFQQFLSLLKKADTCYSIRYRNFHSKRTAKLVEVLPGYRAHFEAEFDHDGNIISIGQWDSL